jgi:hypothetical protein
MLYCLLRLFYVLYTDKNEQIEVSRVLFFRI